MTQILVSEVGLRDGLQSIDRVMPLAAKKAWIAAEAAAGVREIEVGSFVPPSAAAADGRYGRTGRFRADDSRSQCRGAGAQCQRRGARGGGWRPRHVDPLLDERDPFAAQCPQGSSGDAGRDCRRWRGLPRAPASTSRSACRPPLAAPSKARSPKNTVVRLAEASVAAGAQELSLSDTTGYADPAQVRRLVRTVQGGGRRGAADHAASPQHARAGPRQCAGGAGGRHHHARCLARRAGRLPLCAGGIGQSGDRRSGADAQFHGAGNRDRSRQAAQGSRDPDRSPAR